MSIRVYVGVEIEPESLAEQLNHEQAIEFVKEFDLAFQDAGFTEELARYFVQELAKEYADEEGAFDPRDLLK